jgi:hypothetical protein
VPEPLARPYATRRIAPAIRRSSGIVPVRLTGAVRPCQGRNRVGRIRMTCEYVARYSSVDSPMAAIWVRYFAKWPAGRTAAAGSSRSSATPWSMPMSKSSSGSPRASMADGLARRLATFFACGLLAIRTASPSQLNQTGTRWGRPLVPTLLSHTTVSVRRSRSIRAPVRSVVSGSMPRSCRRHEIAASGGRLQRPWTSDDAAGRRSGESAGIAAIGGRSRGPARVSARRGSRRARHCRGSRRAVRQDRAGSRHRPASGQSRSA